MIKQFFIESFFLIIIAITLFGCNHQDNYFKKKENLKAAEIKQKSGSPSLSPDLISVIKPIYSLNDKYIIFVGQCNRKSFIYRINSDGTKLKKLTEPFGYSDYDPIILPNNKVLFSSVKKYNSCPDLCIMNIDGKNPKWLTKNGNGGFWTINSEDGKTLYFVSSCPNGNNSTDDTYDIYAIKADGTNRRRITSFKDFFIRNLSISTDGRYLLFQRQTVNFNPRDESLWILSLDNENECYSLKPNIDKFLLNYENLKIAKKENVSITYSNMNSPQYSPNEDSILFVWPGHYQGYFGHEIYLMDLETHSTKKLTNLKEFVVNPSFSNDGKKIIFSVGKEYINSKPQYFELWRINIDGTGLEKINISK